jgi:hypothetical protein
MKSTMLCTATALFLMYPNLHARTVTPQELKVFAAQSYHIDYNKADSIQKDKILALYNQRVQTAEIVASKLKNDPEYNYAVDSLALGIWAKRTAAKINPTDEELKKVFESSKEIKVPAKYKIRKLTLHEESAADELVESLNKQSGSEERSRFFAAYLNEHAGLKSKEGDGVWVAANTLPQKVRKIFREKESGEVIKLASENKNWDIVLIEEIQSERPANFEEAKPFILKVIRQKGVEAEMKRLNESVVATPAPKAPAIKGKAPAKPIK